MKSFITFGYALMLSLSFCTSPPDVVRSTSSQILDKEKVVLAAKAFLESLSQLEKKSCQLPFKDVERENWHFVPIKRRGLALQLMSARQKELAADLLKACLSQEGYRKVEDIRQLESILTILEKRAPDNNYRNPELYFVSIFGEPADANAWGWRFEGHHLSLNYTFADGRLNVTPQFMGANPAEVPVGDSKGKRVMAQEEDRARALVQSLEEVQLELALIAKRAYPEIITGNDRRVSLQNYEGLPYKLLNESQQLALIDLIQLYLNNNEEKVARAHWKVIQAAGVETLYFAWAGGIEKGEKHYYRIHGPRLLIEFDNTQNGGNHVHSVCRDPSNDFGEDALRIHYQTHRH
ncbi:MAG: DUF3500 domain-containing protein [Saprospiraceae bacterium]|nr:DUF3500 domain-containing protein [Saprospiraceae bacterium]